MSENRAQKAKTQGLLISSAAAGFFIVVLSVVVTIGWLIARWPK